MGTWIAKLAGHKDGAEKDLKDPHSIAAYTLMFGLALLILLLWIVIVIVTTIRCYKKYKVLEKNLKATLNLQVGKKIVGKLRHRLSIYGVQEEEFQMVELTSTPGPDHHAAGHAIIKTTQTIACDMSRLNRSSYDTTVVLYLTNHQKEGANLTYDIKFLHTYDLRINSPYSAQTSQSLQSSKLGIRLAGGEGSNHIPGDPGIFVVNVRPGSIADGKLYPGDRIVAINDFHMGTVSLKYAKEVMYALRQAEGHMKFLVKRAPLREQRVNEAFTVYCDDEETGKKEVVFSKEHMEVFEEAFSVYDVRGSGKIPKKRFFELLRTLGYNIHKAEAYEYMNELELAEKSSITFNELVKFLEHVVADQTAKHEVQSVYNVFDQNQIGHVPVSELTEALKSLYGTKLSADVLQDILSLADLDKDGSVSEEDFERLLLPSLMLY